MKTGYKISPDGKTITCLRCRSVSHNRNDIKNRYCGFCHLYHEDRPPVLGSIQRLRRMFGRKTLAQ